MEWPIGTDHTLILPQALIQQDQLEVPPRNPFMLKDLVCNELCSEGSANLDRVPTKVIQFS